LIFKLYSTQRKLVPALSLFKFNGNSILRQINVSLSKLRSLDLVQ